MSSEGEKIVVVDLDGTLAQYDGWKGDWEAIGEPITDVNGWTARDFMLRLQRRGYRTIVYSSRGDTNEILHWLEKHGIPCNAVNGPLVEIAGMSEKPIAVAYVDDRAVRFAGNYRSALVRVIHLAGDGASPPASAVAPSELWRTSSLPGDESEQELRPTGEGGTAENGDAGTITIGRLLLGDDCPPEAETEPIELEVSPAGEASLIAAELEDVVIRLGGISSVASLLLAKELQVIADRITQNAEGIRELQRERDYWLAEAEGLDDEDVFGDGGYI